MLLLLAFAVPAALVALFAGSLMARRDPRRVLLALGILRVLLALVFVAEYFHTVEQLMVALAFGLALSSSMRAALRRAAVARGVPLRARGTLASGDQLAAGILAVAGPALTTLLYVLNGERIFTIAVGAALCYIVALMGESQAEPLPDKILYQRPADDEPKVENVWDDDEDAIADSQVIAAEAQAQVWELAAPPTPVAAFRDIGDGLGIAGTSSHARAAFWALTLLALAGGILAVAEPFYLWLDLGQEPFMLGLLFTATGLGAAVASAVVVEARRFGRIFLVVGLLAGGTGLVALPRLADLPHALGAIALIGAANVLAIRGGQMVLLQHFVPAAQRAVAAAGGAVTALMAPLGMLAGFVLIHGVGAIAPLGLDNALIVGGAGVVLGGAATAVQVVLPNKMVPDDSPAAGYTDMDAEADQPDDWDGAEDDGPYDDDMEDSRRYPRYRDRDDRDRYDDSARYEAYSAEYPAYSDEYETPRRSRYDDDDDRAPRQRSPRR
jgi:MFS family permease